MTFVATIPFVSTKTELLAWLSDERIVDPVFAALAEPTMLLYAKRATNIFNNITDWVGYKTDELQPNVFPRNGETTTPNTIIKACSIYAYELWQGNTIESRLEVNNIASENTGSASVSYRGAAHSDYLPEEVYSLLAPYRMDSTIGRMERNS